MLKYPSMEEIAKINNNGYNVVSFFSGAGGSCLGFKQDGYRILYANEFVEAAQTTYRANHPFTFLDSRDIRTIDPNEILEQFSGCEIDVVEGSPPCASFSTAGTRQKGWGAVKAYSTKKQRVDDLFWEFARMLKGLKPKVFVAENVKGLTIGKARPVFNEILSILRDCGYEVEAKVLDAQDYNVPQRRLRVIFIGVRDDLDIQPSFPEPYGKRYTISELFPYIKRINIAGKPNNWADANRPASTVVQSDGRRRDDATAYFSSYRIETEDGVIRKYTIEELRTICGFPQDFILTGNFAEQWERLGRAVPPPMMYAVAKHIREHILEKVNGRNDDVEGSAIDAISRADAVGDGKARAA